MASHRKYEHYDDEVVVELSPEEYLRKLPPTRGISVLGLNKPVRRRYLNDEEVFNNWIKLGNSDSLYAFYIKSGLKSPHTKKPPTEYALLTSVFRYIVNNFDTALSRIKQAYLDANELYDEDEIIVSVIEKAGSFLGRKVYLRFIVEKKLYEKYFDRFSKQYALGDEHLQWMIKSDGDYEQYRIFSGTASRRVLDRIGFLASEGIPVSVRKMP